MTDYPKADLVADARWLATTLAETHPDPYDGHGGRVAYHRHLAALVRSIPEDGESRGRFHRRVQGFAAGVRDGHTAVAPPDDDGEDDGDGDTGTAGRFPLGWRVVGPALYVDAVYEASHADLLGGRLRRVAGVPVADLRERVAGVESADNRYGDLRNLASALGPDPGAFGRLVDGDATAPTVTVETADGATVERALEPVAADDPAATLDEAVGRPATSGEPAYRLLDGGDAAVLSFPDGHSYRELHEVVHEMGAMGELYDPRAAYERVVGEAAPDDPATAIEGLPAVTETLADLFDEMAAAGTGRLVVDVRDNTGGSSLFAYALVWALEGWDGVVRTVSDQFSVPKDSTLYREEYGDAGPLDDPDDPAGFDFADVFDDPEEAAAEVRQQFELSGTLSDALGAGPPDYRPDDVVVVTSARTFSAGLEPAVLLSKLGARVVGVPSRQAPNGPRDVLFAELPNTGLDVRVSYRHHEFCPGEDGRAFDPDVELTPARFEAMERPADAGLKLGLPGTATDE